MKRLKEFGVDYKVFNDYPMLPGSRRSLSTDLAVVDTKGQVLVAIEFKFEPSHRRLDIMRQKLPVIGWSDAARDIERVRTYVELQKSRVAYAVLIDEGGCFRHRQPPNGSKWIDWSSLNSGEHAISLLWTRFGDLPAQQFAMEACPNVSAQCD